MILNTRLEKDSFFRTIGFFLFFLGIFVGLFFFYQYSYSWVFLNIYPLEIYYFWVYFFHSSLVSLCGVSMMILIKDPQKFFITHDCFRGRTEEIMIRDLYIVIIGLTFLFSYLNEILEEVQTVLSFAVSLLVYSFYTRVVSYYKKLTGFVKNKK